MVKWGIIQYETCSSKHHRPARVCYISLQPGALASCAGRCSFILSLFFLCSSPMVVLKRTPTLALTLKSVLVLVYVASRTRGTPPNTRGRRALANLGRRGKPV